MGKEVYEHRDQVAGLWESITTRLRGKKTAIAITGLEAAGKTVLLDHITGKAFNSSYRPPEKSSRSESETYRPSRQRIAISVIPGQVSEPRHVAIDEIFLGKEAVSGVIHVVCNGFNEPRNALAEKALVEQGALDSIDKYREHQLKRELEDLNDTCELIRQANRNSHRPDWMIVAVAKADLFADRITDAEQYYSEHSSSAFSARLTKLVTQIGSDNFRWTAAPVSTWLEDFGWNGKVTPSSLKVDQRNQLLSSFVKQVEAHCAR